MKTQLITIQPVTADGVSSLLARLPKRSEPYKVLGFAALLTLDIGITNRIPAFDIFDGAGSLVVRSLAQAVTVAPCVISGSIGGGYRANAGAANATVVFTLPDVWILPEMSAAIRVLDTGTGSGSADVLSLITVVVATGDGPSRNKLSRQLDGDA